jgi:hypothetical protein
MRAEIVRELHEHGAEQLITSNLENAEEDYDARMLKYMI